MFSHYWFLACNGLTAKPTVGGKKSSRVKKQLVPIKELNIKFMVKTAPIFSGFYLALPCFLYEMLNNYFISKSK